MQVTIAHKRLLKTKTFQLFFSRRCNKQEKSFWLQNNFNIIICKPSCDEIHPLAIWDIKKRKSRYAQKIRSFLHLIFVL